MNRFANLAAAFVIAAAACFSPSALVAEEHFHQGWECCAQKRDSMLLRSSLSAADDDSAAKQGDRYARDRRVDITHVKLEVTPDFAARTLEGITELNFAPIAEPLRTLELDAVDLEIAAIDSSHKVEDFQITEEDKLAITFAEAIPAGAEAKLTIRYSCEPSAGWYFRTEAMGYPKGDDHAWTQGEPEKHRHWFPGYDYPNERFTTEVVCHVPEGMTVLSNGRLLGEKKNEKSGLVAFHWLQDQPHVNYLISVVAGYFEKLEDKHGDLPLAFYTPPSEFANAANSFRDTRAIIDFFEEEIGVDYPWDKYFSVCVSDFIAGGMENTSVTTLTTGTLFSAASENIHTSHRLDAHEAAHQWFGDLVTCQDWSQLWLNEGFATYYTQLYEEKKNGRDAALYGMYRNANTVLRSNDDKPITWRGYDNPKQQFDYRAYPKGAWVLHMLRSQLGADLYRDCIRTYLERHRGGVVVTRDLMEVIEELSGRSWERFFDQWVHHGSNPKLKVAYKWDEEKKKVSLTIEQTQPVNERVMRFEFPLPVRFITEEGTHDFVAEVKQAKQTFSWDLPGKPTVARLDPDATVLAKIDFTPPNPLLHAQLELEDDMLGRLYAVQLLGGRKDAGSVAKLKERLNGDAFYAVRIEAAKALAKTHNEEALAGLLESLEQDDARVRQEVVFAIGKFFDEEAYAALVDVIEKEANPDIVTAAVSALGKFPQDEVEAVLLTAMRRESFRNQIAVGAISAAQIARETSLAAPLLDYLRAHEADFVSRDFASVLNSLGVLVSDDEAPDRDAVREFVTSYVNHPKERVRVGAMKALGSIGDKRAISVLETFLGDNDGDSADAKAADAAIQLIRGGEPQAPAIGDLRKELMELQKKVRAIEAEQKGGDDDEDGKAKEEKPKE